MTQWTVRLTDNAVGTVDYFVSPSVMHGGVSYNFAMGSAMTWESARTAAWRCVADFIAKARATSSPSA